MCGNCTFWRGPMTPLTLDAIDALVSEIREGDASKRAAAIEKLVRIHEIINLELGRGSIFWRARLSQSSGFGNERDLSYPPHAFATAGRCNDPKEPSLYLSCRRETALSEIGVRAGDYVHASGYQIRPGAAVRVLSLGEQLHVQRRGTLLMGSEPEAARAVSAILNGMDQERARMLVYLDSVLAGLLTEADGSTSSYEIQRAILRAINTKLPDLQGVLYPSTKDALGLNLAIRAGAADSTIESCCSMVLKINKVHSYGMFDLTVIRTADGVTADGDFVWSEDAGPKGYVLYRLTKEEAESEPRSIEHLVRIRRGLRG